MKSVSVIKKPKKPKIIEERDSIPIQLIIRMTIGAVSFLAHTGLFCRISLKTPHKIATTTPAKTSGVEIFDAKVTIV
ncbi:MAG: hypothetical protein ACTFAL_15390 [Candidatus Electronema sp. V4]|uniref:hypothetical protein n=1 Tax=Candidatus Electronema sp. V4 TaxID=3454756 RepID=UPI00405572EA